MIFDSITEIYRNPRVKEVLRVTPKIGVAILLLFIFLPSISTLFNVDITANWYIVSNASYGYLSATGILIILFVWIFVYFLQSSNLRMRLSVDDASPEIDDADIHTNYLITRVNLISLLLVSIFFLQLWLNNPEMNKLEGAVVLVGAIILWLFLYLIFSHIRSFLSYLNIRLRARVKSFSVEVMDEDKLSAFEKLVVTYKSKRTTIGQAYSNQTSVAIESSDTFDYALRNYIDKNVVDDPNKSVLKEVYISFTKELGLWSLGLAALSMLVLLLTGPVNTFHEGFPVIFFITQLLIVLLWGVNLVIRQDIRIITINTLAELCADIAKYPYFLTKIYKKHVLGIAVFLTISLLVSFWIWPGDSSTPDNAQRPNTDSGIYFNGAHMASGSEDEKPVIIVTASGGGIAASAWTTAVLRKIEKIDPALLNNVVAISGVSGGALGAYYFVAKELLVAECAAFHSGPLNDNFLQEKSHCRKAINRSLDGKSNARKSINYDDLGSRSSLGAVAWGAIRYDILGLFNGKKSRGDALIERWSHLDCDDKQYQKEFQNEMNKWHAASSFDICNNYKRILEGTFSNWRTNEFKAPTLLINATQEQSGIRTVLSSDKAFPNIDLTTADITKERYISSLYAQVYNSGNCLQNTRVDEAVKHSATFPYVTGSSQITHLNITECGSLKGKKMIDGGYLDNHGTYSALEYLDHLGQLPKNKISQGRTVILLNINAYPAVVKDLKMEGSGIIDELFSPLVGLAGIRKNQKRSGLVDIKRAQDKFNLIPWEITLDEQGELPLSWHISKGEKKSIKQLLDNTSSENSALDPLKNNSKVKLLYSECLEEYAKSEQVRQRKRMKAYRQVECLLAIYKGLDKDLLNPTPKGLEGKDADSVLVENNYMLKTVLSFVNKIDLNPNWVKYVVPKFCAFGETPRLIAGSPLFKLGDYTSPEGIVYGSSCELPMVLGKGIKDKLTCSKLGKQEVHLLGFASQEKDAVFNIRLSEKRINWLSERLLERGIAKQRLIPHALGESAHLIYPFTLTAEQTERFDGSKSHLNRYSMAFYCEK